MKKIVTLLLIVFLTFLFFGCDFKLTTKSTTETTSLLSTTLTDSTNTTITESTTLESSTTKITTTNTVEQTTTQVTSVEITTTAADIINILLSPGQDTVEYQSEWIDAGATLIYNNVSYQMTTDDVVDENQIGIYVITYEYVIDDTTYSITRYVAVVDQTAPEIQLNMGVDTILIGGEWNDAGVSVSDNLDEVLEVIVTGTVDTSTVGTYIITYTVTDSFGNSASCTRYVNVINLEGEE